MDKQLPFGLRSAPFLFNELAKALHWIITNNYHIPYLIHYLDDFLLVSPTQPACLHAKNTIVTLFTNLRIPLSWNKIEGPSTLLTFLGIQLDTKVATVPPQRQAQQPPITTHRMANQEEMHKTPAPVPDWTSLLCRKSHPHRENLPAMAN